MARRPLELSGALGRSQARERVQVTRSLMRCRVGRYALVVDLRDLSTLDSGEIAVERPDFTVDLRRVFGVEETPGARALPVRGLTGERVELLVDPGLELVSVDLTELYAFPALLHHAPALRCLCGVITLCGELHFLLDPQPVIEHALRQAQLEADDDDGPECELIDTDQGAPRG